MQVRESKRAIKAITISHGEPPKPIVLASIKSLQDHSEHQSSS